MKIKNGFATHFVFDRKLPVQDRHFQFLRELPSDLRIACLDALRTIWTHASTAIEGNTFSLSDTAFFLAEGLTVSGRTIREHVEIFGHAATVEDLYDFVESGQPLSEEWLFRLHRLVMLDASVIDVYSPVGAWKIEPNGTNAINPKGDMEYLEYSPPRDVPFLMASWLEWFNSQAKIATEDQAVTAYAQCHMSFVRIHPFADGNGRMARLVANIPLLRAGFPPVIIAKEARREYLTTLALYEFAVGVPNRQNTELLPSPELLSPFSRFCEAQWAGSTRDIVAHYIQRWEERNLALAREPEDGPTPG